MYSGHISPDEFDGSVDLHATLESGQTFHWRRGDGKTYGDESPARDAWYYTAFRPRHASEPLALGVREHEGGIDWQSTVPDGGELVRELLGLDDDLPAIIDRVRRAAGDDDLLRRALAATDGHRLVNDPPFVCLVSFICSSQMRVDRIHEMQVELADRFGTTVKLDGRDVHAYPTPDQLADAGEEQLKDAGLGYRASYVSRTASTVAGGDAHPADYAGIDYETARNRIQTFTGVGDKVADCVLLFSLGYTEPVPLDTWVRSAIEEHYPECASGNYADTSAAIRERWGSYAGYAQTYVFDYLRRRGDAD